MKAVAVTHFPIHSHKSSIGHSQLVPVNESALLVSSCCSFSKTIYSTGVYTIESHKEDNNHLEYCQSYRASHLGMNQTWSLAVCLDSSPKSSCWGYLVDSMLPMATVGKTRATNDADGALDAYGKENCLMHASFSWSVLLTSLFCLLLA